MIMMSFVSIALVTVVWLVAGYSLAFGDDIGGGLIGGLEARWAWRASSPTAVHGQVPDAPLRHLPADLRDHHRRADQRRDRRPGEVRRVDGLRARLGARSSTHPSRTGSGAPAAGSSRARRPRLRGRSRRRDHLRRLRPGPGLVLGPRLGFKKDADAAAQPAAGAAGRRPALVRLVRLQRRLGARRQRLAAAALPQHPRRRLHRPARLALRRAAARRPPHHARRGVRRGRRPGRDHPVLRLGVACSARWSSARRRCRLLVRRGWKFQLELRRLARRRRRPPGRRHHRHDPDRPASPTEIDDRRRRRASCTAAGSRSSASRWSPWWPSPRTRSP